MTRYFIHIRVYRRVDLEFRKSTFLDYPPHPDSGHVYRYDIFLYLFLPGQEDTQKIYVYLVVEPLTGLGVILPETTIKKWIKG